MDRRELDESLLEIQRLKNELEKFVSQKEQNTNFIHKITELNGLLSLEAKKGDQLRTEIESISLQKSIIEERSLERIQQLEMRIKSQVETVQGLDDVEERLNSQANSILSLEVALSEKNSTIEAQCTKIQTLESSLSSVNDKLEEKLYAKNMAKETETQAMGLILNDELEKRLHAKYRIEVESLEVTVQEKDSQIGELQADLTKLITHHDTLSRELQELQEYCQMHKGVIMNVGLESKLINQQTRIQSLENTVAEKDSLIKAERKQANSEISESVDRRELDESSEIESISLQKSIIEERSLEIIQQLEMQIKSQLEKIQVLEKNLTRKETEMVALHIELGKAKEKPYELKKEIETIPENTCDDDSPVERIEHLEEGNFLFRWSCLFTMCNF